MTDAPKTQADKFRELARELECDEDEAAFGDKVRRVVQAPQPECVHCGRAFALHQGHVGEVTLCDDCLHND